MTEPARILRWTVPVDGAPHRIPSGVIHVGARTLHAVEVWTEPSPSRDIVVTVVGTGHQYPDHWSWIGTALAPQGLVWHLMRTQADPADLPGPSVGL